PPQSAGTTYYVSPTGSDSNPGTASQPFQTIQRAADVVNPGDTVLVADGTYTRAGEAIVYLNRGGSATNWAWFKSCNPLGAKLHPENNANATGVQFGSVGYIRWEGFEIFGMKENGTSGAAAIDDHATHDVQIMDNDLHDIGKQCSDTQYGHVGIF